MLLTMFDVVSYVLHAKVEASRDKSQITHAHLFSAFECVHEPRIDIANFLSVFRPAVDNGEWVIALVLVNRLLKKSGFSIGVHNVHRLMFTALLITMKQLRGKDEEKLNVGLGRIIQMDPAEVGAMERAFLCLTEWDLHVSLEEYAVTEKRSLQMLVDKFAVTQ
eukprot:Hpha_TRINITY_DN14130_c0_g1::TRINITY_DN14130_c0_g1_i1::g.10798::m.10798